MQNLAQVSKQKSTKQNFEARFSVVVPVLNEEKLLPQFLNQFTDEIRKNFNIELIISDGGSTDKSVEIANSFADIVVVHDSSKKQTIAEGRNEGARVANSDVFIFLNADTKFSNIKRFFEKLEVLMQEQNFDAIATYVTSFPEQTYFKDKMFYGFFNKYFKFLNIIGLGMGRGECQIVKKSSFIKVEGYNSTIAAGEDFDLYRRIASFGKVIFADDLVIFESPRRFRKNGYFKTIFWWTLNALSVWIFGKSVSKIWEEVR